jgi:hypothetical protein
MFLQGKAGKRMKKMILAVAVFGCAVLLCAQNGYAHNNLNEGCLTSCHSASALHAGATHASNCTACHPTSAGGLGTVLSSKCIVCHPLSNPGKCNLVKTTPHAAASPTCISCHTDCKSSCPAAKVLGDEDPRLAKLRDFRDKVLAKSAFGKRIIDSYYNNADTINAALEKNPTLKAFSYKALQSFIPVAEIFM